ncbi:MAG: adenylate/guanylate cyclase domain-containing protein, partial [Gemmatimonadetes bacterium]|nr:adenylate/guanylate cyclase domain-containing protein [Gemmatimonadota bacterium]NIR40557.1 adenylate/guanylate cyclase domain-containing protein [Actinomycetota bacterium]NIS35467.1 adenylate/guanylate cyclase domain-containing protein [Actinomycetota bacterium]NIU70136.1 adenylate/guanylate cyclase domain-containing protein [Actinomycetota bacterium]NIW32020.1 adenylate/guanylate cyclase domain-containing protein [Actinomycetota bacterium]
PQILYQTSADGPDGDFPAVRAVPADRHNLTPPLTPTVGRAALVSEVIDAVRPGSVVTLIGPGGVGKTRIAVEVSISIAPAWDDGVWRVD